tara:strand:- start:611 stop:793 length:183 start_codon:yes stop_codon:yes gene_type:complete
MFKLKEVINYNINEKLKPLSWVSKLKTCGLLNKEFDWGKDELSELEMNEINIDLKQRWLK